MVLAALGTALNEGMRLESGSWELFTFEFSRELRQMARIPTLLLRHSYFASAATSSTTACLFIGSAQSAKRGLQLTLYWETYPATVIYSSSRMPEMQPGDGQRRECRD